MKYLKMVKMITLILAITAWLTIQQFFTYRREDNPTSRQARPPPLEDGPHSDNLTKSN
jgi:hypothetical protein